MSGREIVLGVTILAIFADTATAIVLWSRRGGRVWALLCVKNFGLWLLTAAWLLLTIFYPQRYDAMPWPIWFSLLGRMIISAASWRLAYRVLRGNRV